MAERDKIFASKAWRATRAVQKAAAIPWHVLAPLRRLASRLGTRSSDATAEAGPLPPDAAKPLEPYQKWVSTYDTLSPADSALIAADMEGFEIRPVISLLIQDSGAGQAQLEKTTASIRGQLYPDWEICLGKNSDVTGSFLALLEPGDILPEQALYEIVREIQAHPEAALIYTDEDKIDDQGRRHDPVLKPAFSIELQLGCPLTGSLTVYRRSALKAIGIAAHDIERSQEQVVALGVALRCGAPRIRHIPAVLCHHLASGPEAIRESEPEETAKLVAAAQRIAPIKIDALPGQPNWHRVIWPLPATLPRVSVIVPTRDRADLLVRCVLGLLYRTDYPNLEVLIINNDSIDVGTMSLFSMLQTDPRVRIISIQGPFNYSALNNAAAREATGDILVLLNNDVDVIEGHWLKEMVSHAVRPDVGAVGAKLLFADGRIQHAGVVLGVGQHNAGPGVAGHFGLSIEADDPGYLGQFAMTREVSAVTGACLAVRREVYESVGGLNEEQLLISFNDVDFCLRIKAKGFRIIWTPFAVLYHLESASRGRAQTPAQVAQAAREADYMRDHWGPILDKDPFYNLAFDRKDHTFELARPPYRQKPWRHAALATGDAVEQDL
jgi:GT2 family glycosyltransferase